MRTLIDTLEPRRLMSVRPDGTVPAGPPADTTPVITKGVLAVDGTGGDDNIDVRFVASKAGVPQLAVRVVSGTTADGRLNGTVTRNVLVPADQVERVVVTGGGGTDQLATDVTAFKITKSVDVDNRVVANVNRAGRTTYVEDPMAAPLPGVLAGSTTKWAERSLASAYQVGRGAKYYRKVLFVGNSHINYLPQTGAAAFQEKLGSVPAVNFGLPGDTTSQVLYRIQNHSLLTSYVAAKVVVLEVGSNNVALSDDVSAIVRGVKAVVSEVARRLPNTAVIVNSILPRRTNAENKVVNKVNDQLAAFYTGRRVRFLNVTDSFAGKTALAKYYKPNDIHLNSNGYRVWVDRLTPSIDYILNDLHFG